MFTYPIWPTGGFLDEEWMAVISDGENKLRYFNTLNGDMTQVARIDSYTGSDVFFTDNHLITVGSGIGDVEVWAYKGTTVISGTGTPDATVNFAEANNTPSGIFWWPDGYITIIGGGGASGGVHTASFLDESPYTLGTVQELEPVNDQWRDVMDFRVSAPNQPGYGDVIVTTPANNSNDFYVYTHSAGTLTQQATLNPADNMGSNNFGWDRDNYFFVTGGTSISPSQTCVIWDLNPSTYAITRRGSFTTTTGNIYALACWNGHVITAEESGGTPDKLNIYSLDGTTETLEDSIDYPAGTGVFAFNGFIQTSPFTNLVYAAYEDVVCYDMTGATFTQKDIVTGPDVGSTGAYHKMAFSDTALPDLS